MKKELLGIFAYFITIRILFIYFSGFNSYELSADSFWINELSERVLQGDFDFDIGRFIVSPLYPILIALHKIVFGSFWEIALVITQIGLSGLSGVYFYKLGNLLFKKNEAIISTVIFGIFPMTLWWVHTFSAESTFQSLLIISIYFLVKTANHGLLKDLLISGVLFSLTFLTKSHILLFTPFLAFYLFLNLKKNKKVYYPILYGGICLLFTIPFGLYNLNKHEQYVLSSNGAKFHFYTGNSNYGYKLMVDVPEKESEEFNHLSKMNMAYFNGNIHTEILKKPHKIKQDEYFNYSTTWIKQNKTKFLKLKAYNTMMFLLPGVSFRHYPTKTWLISLVFSIPIYFFGYLGMFTKIKKNYKKHFFSLGLFCSLLLFSVIWYTQNRFRTITVEPIYILYSGTIIIAFLKLIFRKKISD